MRLLSGTCGHNYCESCLNLEYIKGPTMVCRICSVQLRRGHFSLKFDDASLEKENKIRKRVLDIFNKRLEDFNGNLLEYNDYLEMTEDIIFEMMDTNTTHLADAKMKEYQRLNQASIITNKVIKEKEESEIAYRIQEENKRFTEKRIESQTEDQKELQAKALENKKAMDDLAKGKINANDLKEMDKQKSLKLKLQLQQQQQQAAQPVIPTSPTSSINNSTSTTTTNVNNNNNNTNNNNGGGFNYQPQVKAEPTKTQQQQQQAMAQLGPQPLGTFKYDELGLKNLIPTMKQSDVGGFKQSYIEQRAFQESFENLFKII
ncbi:CDK-activating kinase assembly factor MAT1 [Tieghemostelium lacteum]|uniref:CDK-activating kinase assembly factor MAT1 n=1 Tax=Tieghemostelium lacteum TaxID=361077 RepID=A0A151Z6I7_TIELA|nr:CDK-activating kinase assembly factor MAT1 [Tieghemostelium lacteum]|eukprot:KYQ89547.1 CDK-activating kinase assembly factor MAT1 [Tieghemostelium lacteum]